MLSKWLNIPFFLQCWDDGTGPWASLIKGIHPVLVRTIGQNLHLLLYNKARFLTLDCGAEHAPPLWWIKITQRQMHCRPVVPADKIANTPLMAVNIFRPRRMVAKIFDKRPALFEWHSVEMLGAFPDIQSFFTTFVMYTNTRMSNWRVNSIVFGKICACPVSRTWYLVKVINGVQVLNNRLHFVG